MMDRDGQDGAASIGAQRVRDHRARRRAAGLVEVKAWVRAQGVVRAHAALRPLADEADRVLARSVTQGRTNQVAVELRFPGMPPPASFRDRVLRRGWGLVWDRDARCWRRMVEDPARVEELRRLVTPHGGEVEAG